MKSRYKILVADDDDRIRTVLSDILLAQGYKVSVAFDGVDAIEHVAAEPTDVILLDMNMPRMGGIDVIKTLKADPSAKVIPIVVVTGEDDLDIRVEALKLGADDFLIKPPHIAELTARVRSLVKVKAYNDYMRHSRNVLEQEVRKRTMQLNESHERLKNASLDTIYRLSTAAEYKDEDTSFHLRRMSNYAAAIAIELGLDDSLAESILYSSPMHDIGKIGIPDRILLKPAKLTTGEWTIMRRHTNFGGRILDGSESEFLKMGRSIAMTHHERWDGTGYPHGLAHEEIPIEGRVTALADVFDALTTKRPYKEAFTSERACEIIRESRGSHFDPQIVDAFFAITPRIEEIKRRYQDNGMGVFHRLAGEKSLD